MRQAHFYVILLTPTFAHPEPAVNNSFLAEQKLKQAGEI
jgi:hypothetical protein